MPLEVQDRQGLLELWGRTANPESWVILVRRGPRGHKVELVLQGAQV